MRSNMTITVEFLAGTDIKEAVLEASKKARALDVAYVCFDFNGTMFSIGGNCDLDEVMERWNDRDIKHGICSS